MEIADTLVRSIRDLLLLTFVSLFFQFDLGV